MNRGHKVLLISAPIGSGHIRAAQSVQNAFKVLYPDVQTQLVSIFDFLSPKLAKMFLETYLQIIKHYPQIYGMAYGWGNTSSFALKGRHWLNSVLAGYIQNYIHEFKPSAIISTHATPAGLVANLRQRRQIEAPIFGVITDFAAHRLWVYPELDRYYVACEPIKTYLIKQGILKECIINSGIPVMQEFAGNMDQGQLRKELGLDQQLSTVLLMGGGAGILPMDEIIKALADLNKPIQLITVCGHNQKIFEKIETLKRNIRFPVLNYGFTHNIHELMGAADVLVSKPGGVSSSEALAANLPLVVYNPIPGVETENTQYLAQSGAALRADTISEIIDKLSVLSDSNEQRKVKDAIAILRHPQAAETVASDVMHMILER